MSCNDQFFVFHLGPVVDKMNGRGAAVLAIIDLRAVVVNSTSHFYLRLKVEDHNYYGAKLLYNFTVTLW